MEIFLNTFHWGVSINDAVKSHHEKIVLKTLQLKMWYLIVSIPDLCTLTFI